jgi:hypothetical protein
VLLIGDWTQVLLRGPPQVTRERYFIVRTPGVCWRICLRHDIPKMRIPHPGAAPILMNPHNIIVVVNPIDLINLSGLSIANESHDTNGARMNA